MQKSHVATYAAITRDKIGKSMRGHVATQAAIT